MTAPDTLRTLAAEGLTTAQMARRLRLTEAYVRKQVKHHQIEVRRPLMGRPRLPLTAPVIRAIVREAERQGVEVLEIVRRLNAHVWEGGVE